MTSKKIFSYNRIYLQHVRKLQREMQNLKDWRNKQSDVSTETLADYETKFKNLEDRIAKQECPYQLFGHRQPSVDRL